MKLFNTIINKSSLKLIIISGILFICMYVLINGSFIGTKKLLEITNGINILDMEFGYSVEKAYMILTSLGEPGRSFYLTKIIPLDFVFPLSYMFFYMSVISYLIKKIDNNKKIHILLLLPILVMLFDFAENICTTIMLLNFPHIVTTVCLIASLFTLLKFILIIANMLTIVILLFITIISKLQKYRYHK